ncbi:hypothetical protein O181_054321 [Austropuccinia psidii MF-1]|uniref:Chromo domain-containing protein n=1 Tax=Austropuccinia psidii MF-1 TaxID=1389203 RepID=A0A9Q3E2C2_9BASI|nr:hypothetical protein [Austropuccinia psidii MF-1]
MYVSYHQDDWHTWIPLAEFGYNNAEHSSKKQSTLFNIYERNPRFDSIHISQDSPAENVSTKLQSVQKVFKEELESAIRRFKKYADRNGSIAPDFQPGDKVWLASKNIKTTGPTKKLSEICLGPFEVMHITSSCLNNGMEEQEEWEVAQALDPKLRRGKLWYLVEWKAFSEDPERTTWNQLPTLPAHKTLSRISTHCIQTSLVQIPQEFYFSWCLVWRRGYESKFLSWNAPLRGYSTQMLL